MASTGVDQFHEHKEPGEETVLDFVQDLRACLEEMLAVCEESSGKCTMSERPSRYSHVQPKFRT